MSASEAAVEADVAAGAAAPTGRTSGAGSEAVNRLMPKPLLIVISALLCAMVLIPVLYIVLASLNTDVGVASGEFWPIILLARELPEDLDHCGPGQRTREQLDRLRADGGRFCTPGRIHRVCARPLRLHRTPDDPARPARPPEHSWNADAAAGLRALLLRWRRTSESQIIGTRWGLFIAYLTFALPFSTWVMVTYLRGLPRELEEAARIDGASSLQILFQIIFPLSLPAIVVSGIFAFLLGWNDVCSPPSSLDPRPRPPRWHCRSSEQLRRVVPFRSTRR